MADAANPSAVNPRLARILVSNDDGIDAPGIKLLERIARELSPEVWVVAPEQEQSGASHSLTTRRPIRLVRLEANRYHVDGTPTDCVLLALKRLLRDQPPTLVLSGINGGGNIAEDMTYSGTVAAAMEATLFGVPAIALSQDYLDRNAISFAAAEGFCAETIRRIVAAVDDWPKDTFFNVNFPPVPASQVRGFAVTHQGKRVLGDNLTEGVDPRGRPFYWIGPAKPEGGVTPGSDLRAMQEGKVSITPICLNLTDGPMLDRLRPVFE